MHQGARRTKACMLGHLHIVRCVCRASGRGCVESAPCRTEGGGERGSGLPRRFPCVQITLDCRDLLYKSPPPRMCRVRQPTMYMVNRAGPPSYTGARTEAPLRIKPCSHLNYRKYSWMPCQNVTVARVVDIRTARAAKNIGISNKSRGWTGDLLCACFPLSSISMNVPVPGMDATQ